MRIGGAGRQTGNRMCVRSVWFTTTILFKSGIDGSGVAISDIRIKDGIGQVSAIKCNAITILTKIKMMGYIN